jgi:hypothetical protein
MVSSQWDLLLKETEMFDKLVKENRIWDAHIVAKNVYNRDLANQETFGKYIDFCLKVSQYPIELINRKFFLSEAETALTFFAENAAMTDDILKLILSYRNKIFETAEEISELENKQEADQYKKIEKSNNEILTELSRLKGNVSSAKNQDEFNEYLIKIERKERELDKGNMADEQNQLYNTLTKEFSELISSKIQQFVRQENIAYNKKASEDFKYVFERFMENESNYINSDTNLFALVNKRLFAYDASRLFNETLIYYNHVYSYLFGKLDDNGKYRLTQYSIEAEKIKQ